MPGNTIRINESTNLDWYVGDSKMDDLIEWLNENGLKRDDFRDCDCGPEEGCDICNKKREISKVIDFEDAVEAKSKHQLLAMWIADLTFPGKVSDFIQDVAGHGTGDGEVRWQFCFYTDEHKYSITAIDRKGDKGYLGCTASTKNII